LAGQQSQPADDSSGQGALPARQTRPYPDRQTAPVRQAGLPYPDRQTRPYPGGFSVMEL